MSKVIWFGSEYAPNFDSWGLTGSGTPFTMGPGSLYSGAHDYSLTRFSIRDTGNPSVAIDYGERLTFSLGGWTSGASRGAGNEYTLDTPAPWSADAPWGSGRSGSVEVEVSNYEVTISGAHASWDGDGEYEVGETATGTITADPGFLLVSVLVGETELLNENALSVEWEAYDNVTITVQAQAMPGDGQLMCVDLLGKQWRSEETYTYDSSGSFEYTFSQVHQGRRFVLVSDNGRNFPRGVYSLNGVDVTLDAPAAEVEFSYLLPRTTSGGSVVIYTAASGALDEDVGDVPDDWDPGFRTDPLRPVAGGGCTDDGKYIGECVLYLADILNNRVKDLIDEISPIGDDIASIADSFTSLQDVLGEIRDLLPIEVAVDAQGVQFPGTDEVDDYLERRNNL